jgi:hypothetical protein
MKSELIKFNECLEAIQPLAKRLDKNGKDTFNLLSWWRRVRNALPNWILALRAVLTHVPSSAAAERVFSILKNSFDVDQKRSLADYMGISLQLQFNHRGRSSKDDDLE